MEIVDKLTKEEMETLKYFIFVVLRRLHDECDFLGCPNIRFVFTSEVIESFQKIISLSKKGKFYYINKDIEGPIEYLMQDDVEKSLNLLKKNRLEYLEYQKGMVDVDINNMFLKIDNVGQFFQLLHQLVAKAFGQYTLNYEYNLLYSIWLRMTPKDISNINAFLYKQISFIQNDQKGKGNYFTNYGLYDIYYDFNINNSWFETNQNITFYLKLGNKVFTFPMIHYAIKDEDKEKVCYIYGIQEKHSVENNAEIEEYLKVVRKYLRNKYVKYTFPLVLKIFMEYLQMQHINKIRVPLLEVFNYPYHENLSEISKKNFHSNYSKEQMELFDMRIGRGENDSSINQYLKDKMWYMHVVDKADIISQNKTERLIEIFMVLNEKYSILEFLSDPFIEDDHLYVKIL